MSSSVPGRLSAGEPGWTTDADVVVVGSGIAGLTAALRLRHQVDKVLVVTKDVLSAGSTQWAQGGIAAALGPGDTPDQHERDTLVAGAGCLRPRRGAGAGQRGARGGPRADRARRQLRPLARGRAVADPRGRPPPRPDRARRRRRHRRGDPARAGRGDPGGPGHRGHRARPGRRPAARGRRRGRRDHPARDGRGPARRRRRGALPGRRTRLGRARPGVLPDHQPGGVDRGRHGARAARRRGAARPRVRAVPPDGDVPRPRLARPAAADQRGGPRRGGVPRRLRGQPVHAGPARARRPRAARRRRQGDHPADARDRPPAHVAGRAGHLGRAISRSGSSGSRRSWRPAASTASTR